MWDFFRIFASSKPFDIDMEEENTLQMNDAASYNDDSIKHLEDMEHIRLRPGMYIGKLGDGSSHDDGIYVLIKEVIDNAIDEFTSGFGKRIDMTISFAERKVSIRDYGRGIPLLKMVEAVSRLNTGAKYDSKVFQKSVGLNGVGTKAVNALSSWFKVQSFREGKTRYAEFCEGKLVSDSDIVEFYGAVEHPILYCDCTRHHFHIPIYSRVIIRDPETLEPLPNGQIGLVNLITPMVRATPILSVMTDDLGVLHNGSECGCGIDSPYLEIIGRVGLKEIKTCAAGAAELLGRQGGGAL